MLDHPWYLTKLIKPICFIFKKDYNLKMKTKIDITNKRFTRLTAISRTGKDGKWNFLCDCGAKIQKCPHSVRKEKVKSCGCLQNETRKTRNTKNYKDHSGKKFGRWTAIERDGRKWKCKCDCGSIKMVRTSHLTMGLSISCGCFKREESIKLFTTHGLSNSSEYNTFSSMHQRCGNEKHDSYKNYGQRGIKVCERWNEFENFIEDMGMKPSSDHTLDRINNDGIYEPSNCRWATWDEQAANRRK